MERSTPDTRAGFHRQLEELEAALLSIATGIADRIEPVGAGFLDGDRDRCELERSAHGLLRERAQGLEDDAFTLIARQAPVSADLRRVVAVIRSIVDLERSSKLLVHISASARDVDPLMMATDVRTAVALLGRSAREIFCAGVRSWGTRDGLAINELDALDDEVDRLQEGLLAELYGAAHPVEDVVALALLGRYWERLADHGVGLAGHVSWAVTGDRVDQRRWSL